MMNCEHSTTDSMTALVLAYHIIVLYHSPLYIKLCIKLLLLVTESILYYHQLTTHFIPHTIRAVIGTLAGTRTA